MYVKVVANRMWDVFETQCIYFSVDDLNRGGEIIYPGERRTELHVQKIS